MRILLAEYNRDLGLKYLGRALPGLSLSICSNSQQQLARGKQQPRPSFICQRNSSISSTESSAILDGEAISDTESIYTTDSDWPDWSRWSRRKSSSSSQKSTDTVTTISDYGSEYESVHQKQTYADIEPSTETEEPKNTDTKKLPADSAAALHPAKTGFALWVGNIGPKTTLGDLRVLFGTPHLQSIYLIQRTGCAFINYNNEEALNQAISLFERRGGQLHGHELVIKAQCTNKENSGTQADTASPEHVNACPSCSSNRYFICKSLLVDDLEQAKQTGKWSTQLRNLERFNSAFYNSENTYLVFSANRTSAFYGIARLESPFTESKGDAEGKSTNYNDLVVSQIELTHTPETRHPEDGIAIPEGDIILDPLRGSQFWKVTGCECVEPETEKWTGPAKITWLSPSGSMVPFSQTRQLKNSLNMNKPIKVARDGTEIDPDVGEKLCQMFR